MSNNRQSFNKNKSYSGKKASVSKKEVLNIQLVDRNNVLISGPFPFFTEKVKSIIKGLQGRYVPEDRGWLLSRNYISNFIDEIKQEKLEIPISPMPQFVEKVFQPFSGVLNYRTRTGACRIEYQLSDKLKKVSDLPQIFIDKLYPFQKIGVEFGIRNFGRVLIADEMGVGKTIQALALACAYRADWPCLIVTPSSLRLNWRDEIFKWIEDIKPSEVQVITKSATDIKNHTKVLIISYDLATKMSEDIDRFGFQTTIVDEAHYLKNAEAKRTENLVPIIQKCKHCMLLTGTPAFARPKELYNLLNIIRPDIFNNFREFGSRYCDPKPNRWSGGMDYSGAINTKELHYILTNTHMIRRLKKDVLSELPPKRRQKVEVKVDPVYVKKIQDAIARAEGKSGGLASLANDFMDVRFDNEDAEFEREISMLEEGNKRDHPETLQCYRDTGLAKIEGIRDYLRDLLQNDIKLLVFAHHLEVLNGVEDEVKKLKIKYIRIDGSVNVDKRYEGVKMFQEDEDVKIGILSLTAAGVGLTLTAASTVVFAEMHWTPAVMLQAEDRIHRMGQKNKTCVNYHYLYGEGTLDSLLYKKLQYKLAVVSEILEGKTEYLEVEDNKEKLGSFTTPQKTQTPIKTPTKKNTKEENSTASSKPSSTVAKSPKILDKSATKNGMLQLTSYFQKKSEPKNEQKNETINRTKPKQSEMNSKSNLTKADSLDWDDIERLLEEDRAKDRETMDRVVGKDPITSFNEDIDNIEELDEEYLYSDKKGRYHDENNSYSYQRQAAELEREGQFEKYVDGDDEDEDEELRARRAIFNRESSRNKSRSGFEDSAFNSCLGNLMQNEKSITMRDLVNNDRKKSVGQQQQQVKGKLPAKNEKIDDWAEDLLDLLESDKGNKTKTVRKAVQQVEKELSTCKSDNISERTPVKGILELDKVMSKDEMKGYVKISFPVKKKVEEDFNVEVTEKKKDKKRTFDLIGMALGEKYEPGISGQIMKKVKENKK